MDKLLSEIEVSSVDPEEVSKLVDNYVDGLIHINEEKSIYRNTDIPNSTCFGSAIPVLYPTRLQ